jgi:hypothetical protein
MTVAACGQAEKVNAPQIEKNRKQFRRKQTQMSLQKPLTEKNSA